MEQEQLYLTNKHALLSGGGSLLQDNYYSVLNSTSSLCETTYNYENLISLPSVNFGSSTSVQIQNYNFVGRTILHLRIPRLVASQYINRGWGYGLLYSVSWTMGASSTSQITLLGDSILQVAMAQIEDPIKRNEVMHLAGEAQLADLDQPAGTYHDAYVLLPTPFSTWCDKLPYDSSLLSQPIVITIQFNQSNSVYGGVGVRPTQFVTAELLLQSGALTNKSLSLKNKMIEDPSLISPYPFSHFQNFVSPLFDGKTEAVGKCEVQLTSFPNSDITGIIFWVVADEDKYPLNNSTPNPFLASPIKNIECVYNGKIIFNFPAEIYKMTNMVGTQSASFIPYNTIGPGNTGPVESNAVDVYPIYLDFSRLRSTCIMNGVNHMFNTWRLSNQTIFLRFNTSDLRKYRLSATYVLNGCLETQNGVTSVYID